MTSRADLVNTVEQTLIEVVYQGLGISAAVDRIVDAAMPQITTVEQLEALPDRVGLVAERDGGLFRWEAGRKAPGALHGEGGIWYPAAVLAQFGPLTVVWQPRPDQEPTDA